MNELEKTPENLNNETEVNNLLDRELKALVIKVLTELGKRIDVHSENFNKELENIKKTQSEMKNSTDEIKNTLEGIYGRLSDTEGHISDLEDRIMEITQSEQQKENQIKKEKSLRDLLDNISCTNIRIVGVPEEEEKKKGTEKIFEGDYS